MINVSAIISEFQNKLSTTGSMDAAFLKSVWVAYKAGIADAAHPETHKSMQEMISRIDAFMEHTHDASAVVSLFSLFQTSSEEKKS